MLELPKGTRARVSHLKATKSEADAFRQSFFANFSLLTQHSYLLAYAAGHLAEVDMDAVAAEVNTSVRALVQNDDPNWNDKIDGDPVRLRSALPTLGHTIIQLLVVRLDAMMHELLDDLAGRNPTREKTDQSESFENDLSFLKSEVSEAYKWIIMLSEIRNAIVHNSGTLNSSRSNRLKEAGWQELDLNALRSLLPNGLSMSHFLKMKGAVRTFANISLETCGSSWWGE